jgi:hypothetical protein
MKFEEVLPALRAGKKVKLACWGSVTYVDLRSGGLTMKCLIADDWEIVPEPTRVADYLCLHPHLFAGPFGMTQQYYKATFDIGKQPDSAVLVPGSEREGDFQ